MSTPADPSTEPIAPPPTLPPKKKGGCLKIMLIAIGILIVLAIIGAAMGGGSDDTKTTDSKTPTAQATPQDEDETVTPTPTPTPTKSAVKALAYSGSGNRVVKIKKPSGDPSEPVIVTITYNGGSNFAVWTLDQSLEQSELLVNTIGTYKGTVPVDFADSTTKRIQIDASGPWKMLVRPLTSARRFSGKIAGKGDDVLFYMSDPKVADISHSGSSNFAVWLYTEDSNDLLVNEIGKYKGQSPLTGTGFVVITASGPWTINAK